MSKTIRVTVYHSAYGCDTGCCGHYAEFEDESESGFQFTHPYGEDARQWAQEFAQDAVTEKYGPDHVADLDWDNCIVSDD